MRYKSISCKHNAGNVAINHDGSTETQSITGNSVPVLLNNGKTTRISFNGFIDADNIVGIPRVKLLNITRLYLEEGGCGQYTEIPRDHYIVGAYLHKRVYILLYDDEPRTFLYEEPEPLVRKNVVHHLFKD